MDQIKAMFVKTFASAQPFLSHCYRVSQSENYKNNMCFEILGMDVILDHKLKPWLLEVNHTPSFTTDTKIDELIKFNLINDTFNLLNINQVDK